MPSLRGVLSSRETAQQNALYRAIKVIEDALEHADMHAIPTDRTQAQWQGVLSHVQDAAGIQPHLRKKVK
jgi:hypothetical protein